MIKDNMSQEQIINFLKDHAGEKFSAPQLQRYLSLGISLYPCLSKLRKEKGEFFGLTFFYSLYEFNGRTTRLYWLEKKKGWWKWKK